jgi:hypothetical protein
MKKLLVLGFVVLTLAGFGATRASAYGYYHDDKHWYDSHGSRHSFVKYHGHHGYWDSNNGVRVFINID